MITITTEFKILKAGKKAIAALESPPDRPSDLLSINPNDCFQIGMTGDFRWINATDGLSPENPALYVQGVLRMRRQFLAINHRSGKFFELVSCHIEIDNLSFHCRMVDGDWVS